MNGYLALVLLFFVVGYLVINSNIIFSNITSGVKFSLETLFKDDYYYNQNNNNKNYYSYVNKPLIFDFIPLANAYEEQKEKDNDNDNDKYVILMFDRGYETTFTKAKPILDKYGFKASMFIACGNIEGGKGMSWNQIRELYEEGHDIQAHGSEHTRLTYLKSSEEIESIVSEGKECLEKNGFSPIVFQAPYNKGGDDPEIVDSIAKHFDFAFTGHSELMFLNCDGWENYGYDKKNYDGTTDCNPYFSDGTLTPTNKYAIKEWSHDREHDKIYENSYEDKKKDPHGKKVSKAVLEKFIEVVNSQNKFNKNGEINAIPIVGYHKIDTGKDYYTSQELFEQEMEYLHDNGFKVITLGDLGYDDNQERFYVKNVDSPRSEENSNIISTITNANTTAANTDLLSNQEDLPHKKTNANLLVDIAPKPSNTTKTIDVKAWDNLMRKK